MAGYLALCCAETGRTLDAQTGERAATAHLCSLARGAGAECDGRCSGYNAGAVAPGGQFDYDFTPPDAGTFWYHSHNQSTEQIARGLYGLLIVDEAEPPEVDHDISVVLDDWRLRESGEIIEDFDQMHDWTHAGRIGNFVQASLLPQISQLRRHERLRLRLVNVAVDRVMMIGIHGLSGAIVALDGMPLQTPEHTDHVVLGPAQRADFIVDVTADEGDQALIAIHERDEAFVLADLHVSAGGSSSARGAINPLPSNPLVPLETAQATTEARLIMEGGAMGGLRQGIWKGERLSIQQLVEQGQVWTFNGVAGLPEAHWLRLPWATLSKFRCKTTRRFHTPCTCTGTIFRNVWPMARLALCATHF